jgi:hypothetical protein
MEESKLTDPLLHSSDTQVSENDAQLTETKVSECGQLTTAEGSGANKQDIWLCFFFQWAGHPSQISLESLVNSLCSEPGQLCYCFKTSS